jgi:hypothetical protein
VTPVVILTPDRRLRVFVSSALEELAAERQAVARAILALRLTPVMFEAGARPQQPRDLYLAYLAQSDVFIGLYWQRYGWVGPGMRISGLEEEFALSGELPRLLYVKVPAPGREPQLTSLLARIEDDAAGCYRAFSSAGELGGLVREDLAALLSERFAETKINRQPAAGANRSPASGRANRPAEAPNRSAGSGMPQQLPADVGVFTGRGDEMAALDGLLAVAAASEKAATVVITAVSGTAGVGKTALAVRWAPALCCRARRAAWWW